MLCNSGDDIFNYVMKPLTINHHPSTIILGIGSNLGDRAAYIAHAINLLSKILSEIRISSIYESEALMPEGAPISWNIPFLNLAISAKTELSPASLLKKIKQIEKKVGRKKSYKRWSPREIDIDILAFGKKNITTKDLTIPHKNLLERAFFLLPMQDIAPDWKYPVRGKNHGKTIRTLVKSCLDKLDTKRTEIYLPKKTKIVGILNITPDSFSDGNLFMTPEKAIKMAKTLKKDGADIIDIGAESTRPGAKNIGQKEEWRRLNKILKILTKNNFISVDTRHQKTADSALKLGVLWINDVSGFADKKMIAVAKKYKSDVVIMHNLGIPANPKKTIPEKSDTIKIIYNWAKKKISALEKSGIKKEKIIFDPGIGFGKTAEQSLAIIKSVENFNSLGVRIMIGHSRKSFLKLFTDKPPEERDVETAAISAFLSGKVDYIRVHNVRVNLAALKNPEKHKKLW